MIGTSRKKWILVVIGLYSYFRLTPLNVLAKHSETSYVLSASGPDLQMVPFYWMLGIVGGCITVTLSYVSWRKYKAEKKKRTEKDHNS